MREPGLADRPFDRVALALALDALQDRLRLSADGARRMRAAGGAMLDLLDRQGEASLQQRWMRIEAELWPRWEAGEQRPGPAQRWRWGPAALVLARAVRPGWDVLSRARLAKWLAWLPDDDPLNLQ